MASIERVVDRATRTGLRQLHQLGEEIRTRRLELGVSQRTAASAAGISRSRWTRIEAGAITTLAVVELARIAAVLGLDSFVRLYPGGVPIRDSGHARRLQEIVSWVRRPLTYRLEVGLPRGTENVEQRAWDCMLQGSGERTAIELEMRLQDVQALRRRHDLKRRDDPTEHFLLVVASTRHNRRVLAELAPLFDDLPRLRPSTVRRALADGRHPPTGLMLL